jgi:DNA polymerase-4
VLRRILHFRIVSFAVTVARVQDASLRGRPVLVASGKGPRSVVLAVSEEARTDGVWQGLPLPEALRRCRQARILAPDPDLYARASGAVTSVLARFTPMVEPVRGGRFFADLTGTHRLFGEAVDVAARIQKEIGEGLRLPANAGVAANKLVSGVAARVLRPVGLCDVPPGQEESFLRPVAVRNLPAVSSGVEGRLLSDLNVIHVGQLAILPVPLLVTVFGRTGILLHRQARGLDEAPVRPPARAPGVEETTPALPEDTNDDVTLQAALYVLVEKGCRRLRRMGVSAGEAILSARYSDGVATSRRLKLRTPLNRDLSLFHCLRPVFEEVVARRGRVRSMTLRLTRLGATPVQMSLFPEQDPSRESSLMAALDRLRSRYGESAVFTGRSAALRS